MKKTISAILAVLAISGSAFAGSNYELSVKAPAAKMAEKSVAKIKVVPTNGYKMNVEYPTKVTLTAPEGVTLAKAKLTKADSDSVKVDKASAEFSVEFTAASAGKKTFTGEAKFAVCTETECLNQVAPVSFSVDVK
jgi:methionine-rich copper-binding protein CopC